MTHQEEILQRDAFKGQGLSLNYRVFFTLQCRDDKGSIKPLAMEEREQRTSRLLAAIVEEFHKRGIWNDEKIDDVLFKCVMECPTQRATEAWETL